MEAKILNEKRIELNEHVEMAMKSSVSLLFKNVFDCKPTPGIVAYGNGLETKADLSGIAGLIQSDMHGVLKVGFSEGLIFRLLEHIYQRKFSTIDHSVLDGVGELSNNIYGQFKKEMYDMGYSFRMTIPTVIYGKDHSVYPFLDGPGMLMPLRTDFGDMSISLILNQYLY